MSCGWDGLLTIPLELLRSTHTHAVFVPLEFIAQHAVGLGHYRVRNVDADASGSRVTDDYRRLRLRTFVRPLFGACPVFVRSVGDPSASFSRFRPEDSVFFFTRIAASNIGRTLGVVCPTAEVPDLALTTRTRPKSNLVPRKRALPTTSPLVTC